MIIEVPDHYGYTMANAFIAYGVYIIERDGIVPAFLHQLADVWDKDFRYGNKSYWETISESILGSSVKEILEQNNLLDRA